MTRGNKKTSSKVVRASARRELLSFHRGVRFQVSPHPPNFMSRPWFSLTVRIQSPATTVTLANIAAAITAQLGLAVTELSIRVRSVRLWGPIPVTPNPLFMIVYDLFNELVGSAAVNGVLEQITDYADGVNRAQVAYRFSAVQQQHSLLAAPTAAVLFTSQIGAGSGSVMYIDLLWRVFSTTPTVAFDSCDGDLLSPFTSLVL